MTPQRRVASASHQRNASRSTRTPAGLLVGGAGSLRCCPARRHRAPAGAPNRQARMQNHARSSYDLAGVHQFPVQHRGQAGAVDDEVAHPEVAVHQRVAATAAAGWRPASETPTRTSPWCRPSSSSRSRHSVSWSSLGQIRPSGSARWMAASACAHCVSSACGGHASSRARWMRRTIVSPAMRRRSGTGCPVRQANRRRARMCGTGAPAAAAAALRPRPRVPCRHALRRAGRCAGSGAGAAAVGDAHRTPRWSGWRRRSAGAGSRSRRVAAERRPRASRQLRAMARARRHARPNLNSRCATRRIWISSAPSVIR